MDETIFGVNIMNAGGIVVNFEKNVLRSRRSNALHNKYLIKINERGNQVAITIPPNSEKVTMVITKVDTEAISALYSNRK